MESRLQANIGPVILMAQNRFFNIVGNVLGTPAITYGYTTGTNQIYPSIGGSESSTYTVPADSNVLRTLMRWGNYDTATGAARWCGNSSDSGWSTTCASTSEVPSGYYRSTLIRSRLLGPSLPRSISVPSLLGGQPPNLGPQLDRM